MTGDYRVELDEFAGPLDLLLHLVRKEEVEVESLPVARITEQYLRFVESIPEVDLDRAGDFLLLAAQLLTLKARALLPEGAAQDDAEGARARGELVKDLLEYRGLRERARLLEERAEDAARRFGRETPRQVEELQSFKNIDLWDLVTAFKRLEQEIGALGETRLLSEDDTPLHVYVERVREHLAGARGGAVPFTALFRGSSRAELVATFLALLELVRLGEARARQAGPFGAIEIVSASGA